ncbi:MAG: hypothetical protein LBM69_05755 [Lachnospiraceae bacterium]|nr:hypothetical protein [Lachnospiraceae bacterium]
MDKFEYKIRSEEIRTLIDRRDYIQAAQIADRIDWRRVKSVMMLCQISDVYKHTRRYEEARDILLLAYDRHPGGRAIVYSLCELSIKMEEFVQAVEYYKEFVLIAPKDSSRYILQYKLYEAQDVSLEERIEVLEEFKARDYREKWAYELAYLYHRIGLASRCVEECDELILLFGEGKYVIQAMELKMLHEPLTPQQQQKYQNRFQESDVWEEPESIIDPIANPTPISHGISDNYTKSNESIQVQTMDVGKYNTMNLQKELAEGLKEVLGAPVDVEQDTDSLDGVQVEEVDDNTLIQEEMKNTEVFFTETDTSLATVVTPKGSMQEIRMPEKEDKEKDLSTQVMEQLLEEHRTNTSSSGQLDEVLSMESDGQIRLVLPQTSQVEKQITGQISIKDVLVEWERIKKQNENKRQEQLKQHILHETGPMFTEFEASVRDGLLEKLESESPMEEHPPIMNVVEQDHGVDDSDRTVDETTRNEESTQTGNLTGDEVIYAWRNPSKRVIPVGYETGTIQYEDLEILNNVAGQNTEHLHITNPVEQTLPNNRVEEDIQIQKLDKNANTRQTKEATKTGESKQTQKGKQTEDTNQVQGAKQAKEAKQAKGRKQARGVNQTEDAKQIEATDQFEATDQIEETDQIKATDQIEETDQIEATDQIEEMDPTEDWDRIEEYEQEEGFDLEEDWNLADEGELEEELIQEDPEKESEQEDGAQIDIDDTTLDSNKNTKKSKVRSLTNEEKETFSSFIQRKSVRKQLVNVIDRMSLTANEGNVIVFAEEGLDTVTLEKKLAIHYQKKNDVQGAKIAVITGPALNKQDIPKLCEKMKNGALIIQKAAKLSDYIVSEIERVLRENTVQILLFLEDKPKAMEQFIKKHEQFCAYFPARLSIDAMSNDKLVSYGRQYARELEYSIGELGILALHTRIEERQTSEHIVTAMEVKSIVDEAIHKVNRKTPKHFFDILLAKRYDHEDMVILGEKDFLLRK